MTIRNKTVWITGASGGIGEALARVLASQGACLILSGRNTEKLAHVQQECEHSSQHTIAAFDITNATETAAAVDTVINTCGRIDWLINNAGVSQRSLIMETSETVERQLMEIDYFAQTRFTRLVLPFMLRQGGGKVVMVSSVAGLLGTQYRGAYGAAKAALHMWANSLRAELHHQGIEVATVFPGFVTTNVSLNALTGDGTAQGTMDAQTKAGMSADACAKQIVDALLNGDEHIVVAGRKERYGTWLHRVSPPWLYALIRRSSVK